MQVFQELSVIVLVVVDLPSSDEWEGWREMNLNLAKLCERSFIFIGI